MVRDVLGWLARVVGMRETPRMVYRRPARRVVRRREWRESWQDRRAA